MLHAGGPSNGSSTASGRYSKRSSRHSRSMLRSASPRKERSARQASRPATPPPAMTMRGMSASAMAPCSTAAARGASGTPGWAAAAFPQRQAVAARAPGAAQEARALERVGQQLVGVLLGDPGRRAQALRSACEARVVVEPDDDHRHVGVAGAERRAAEQAVVDDDHVVRGPAALRGELLRLPASATSATPGSERSSAAIARRPAPERSTKQDTQTRARHGLRLKGGYASVASAYA